MRPGALAPKCLQKYYTEKTHSLILVNYLVSSPMRPFLSLSYYSVHVDFEPLMRHTTPLPQVNFLTGTTTHTRIHPDTWLEKEGEIQRSFL